jgi:hypothetical protein
MRSGSTLLHHLLQTNPAIIGAGESNRIYNSMLDLHRLAFWAHYTTGALLKWRSFVTDQINHTRQLQSASLLCQPDVHTVFLIREPRGAIGSMVRELGKHYDWSLQRSIDYYCERHSALCRLIRELGEVCPRRAFAVTYDCLTTDTTAALKALQRHLALPTKFCESYTPNSYTGSRGDPSQTIRTGAVQRPDKHAELDLRPATESDLRRTYALTVSAMRQYCAVAGSDMTS